MSERNFLRAFKHEFGTTPKSLVMKQRMMLAKQRLEFTDDPIKNISRELGYANRRTFTPTNANTCMLRFTTLLTALL